MYPLYNHFFLSIYPLCNQTLSPAKKSTEEYFQPRPCEGRTKRKAQPSRSFRRARFSPAARNCPAILPLRNLGGESAPHALGRRVFGACWFAALTAWRGHESNHDNQCKKNKTPLDRRITDRFGVPDYAAIERWTTSKMPKFCNIRSFRRFASCFVACLSLKFTGIGKKISDETACFAVSPLGRAWVIQRQGSGGSHGLGRDPPPRPA